jgi:hypothetical protein
MSKRKAEVQTTHATDKKAKPIEVVDLSRDYSADVKITSSVGNFKDCSGYRLIEDKDQGCTFAGMPCTLMLKLEIKISRDLYEDTEHIRIRNVIGLRNECAIVPIGYGHIAMYMPIPEAFIGEEWSLEFGKLAEVKRSLPIPGWENWTGQTPITLFSVKFIVPAVPILGDTSVCVICLGDNAPQFGERFIPSCGHLFHLSCIFQYLEFHQLLTECRDCSDHSVLITHFAVLLQQIYNVALASVGVDP